MWVNNVGGSDEKTVRELVETPDEIWRAQLELNLTSAFQGAKAAASRMTAGGVIINISSGAGMRGSPRTGPYAAAKAGMLNLTQTLALELAPRGIRVNAVSPGPVATEAFREVLGVSDQLEQLQATIPLGRLGTPDDIAAAVVFMASPAASWVTGQNLLVAGGRTERSYHYQPTSRLRRSSAMDFEGKVLFATGGGSGIAAATARRFAAGGGRVAIVDLDAGKAQEVASGIDGAIGLGGDVADESSVVAAIESARRAARAHRLRPQRRRPRRVRSDRGVDARGLAPDDGRPRRRHVPRLQARPADHARAGRRLDRQHRVDGGVDGQQQQLALRRGEGRHHLVLPSAGAGGGARRPGQLAGARSGADRA